MQETDRTTFQPPKPGGTGRSFALAMLAHGLLLLALTWGIRWNNQPDTMSVSAELWSALPQEAAPPLQAPETVQTPPPPPPEPVKAPEPAPPPPPKPAAQPDRADADIALQKEKALKEKKQREDKLREEKAQKEKDRKEKERKEKELKDKAEKIKAEQEREEKEREKKKLAEKAKAEEKAKQVAQDKKRAEEKAKKEAQAKAEEEKRSEAQRQANIKRSLGLAGASGSEDAKGTALKSSGPSAEYAGRIVARIKPKITFTGDRDGNPKAEVELRVDSTGTIVSSKLIKSSGNTAWDEAVLKAIDKTETLPRDTDNKVPPVMVISFRPKD
jgi:colicin import membrane protein